MDFIKVDIDDAKQTLQQSQELFKLLASRGSLEIEIYKPKEVDLQQPHLKDELYVIISGQGEFICGDRKTSFKPHDILFAAAGAEHRFVNFSSDFFCWVIFYGPEGGEL